MPTVNELNALFPRLICRGSVGTVAGVEKLITSEHATSATSNFAFSGNLTLTSNLNEYALPGLRPFTCPQENGLQNCNRRQLLMQWHAGCFSEMLSLWWTVQSCMSGIIADLLNEQWS